MKHSVDDVVEFHRRCKLPVRWMGPSFTKAELAVTTSVLLEELCEAVEAVYGRPLPELREVLTKLGPPQGVNLDAPALTKELCDVVFAGISVSLFLGLPLEAAWREVANSNVAKVASDGTVRRRADGKILKPDGWQPPNIDRVLREARCDIDSPARLQLTCPKCAGQHVDLGEWATTRWHVTHLCRHCGHQWAPAEYFTVGVP